jgi:hypothetical protein
MTWLSALKLVLQLASFIARRAERCRFEKGGPGYSVLENVQNEEDCTKVCREAGNDTHRCNEC